MIYLLIMSMLGGTGYLCYYIIENAKSWYSSVESGVGLNGQL